jgi:hypothetical protein
MRRGQALIIVLPALAASLALTLALVGPVDKADAAQARAAHFSLCAADETILFQCRTGMKLVSLCGHRTPTPGARLLYGNAGHLDYASSADAAFSWTEQGGDWGVHIRDGAREHAIYSWNSGGSMGSDGRLGSYSIDGLLLDRGGTWAVDHRCAGEASRNGRFQDFMPEAETPEH